MTIYTLHGISTILVMLAFFGVCWWAFAPRRKARFDEAARLPFSDEALHNQRVKPKLSDSEAKGE